MNKTIVLATDHAGFELKEHVKTFLIAKGYDVKDFGAFEYDGVLQEIINACHGSLVSIQSPI